MRRPSGPEIVLWVLVAGLFVIVIVIPVYFWRHPT
jgi:hypothetical protein